MSTPGIVNYPATLDDVVSLVEVNNNASSTLGSGITATDLLIPVVNIGTFSASGIATIIDNPASPTIIEIFVYTSKQDSNLVVPTGGRGAQGTTAQAFIAGAVIEQRPTARHHTVVADAVRALETKLGIIADTPGGLAQALLSDASGESQWRLIQQVDVVGLATALANVVLKNVAALQVMIGNLEIQNTGPNLILTQVGTPNVLCRIEVGGGFWRFIVDSISIAPIVINTSTGLVSFPLIPALPAINPTDPNQATRKAYVDSKTSSWSISFNEVDPTVTTLASEDRPGAFIPDHTGTMTVTKLKISFTGTHTVGTTLSYVIRYRNGAGGALDVGTVTLNDTNNTQLVTYTFDIADFGVPNNSGYFTFFMSVRSGTLTERNINIGLIGTQTLS